MLSLGVTTSMLDFSGLTLLNSVPVPLALAQVEAISEYLIFSGKTRLLFACAIKQNGISDPSFAPCSQSSSRESPSSHMAFSPCIIAAAFPLPPAIPAATGILFFMKISMRPLGSTLSPYSFIISSAAFHARLYLLFGRYLRFVLR